MCGFAGVVVWDERFRVSQETLERMSAKIAHRGPDGQGLYLNHETEIRPDRPQVGLVHRRLAILDPDPRSNQPFTDDSGRWIVFNGEIYNFRELRAELTKLKPDYVWRSNGDTEVLLLSYDVWGEDCVGHLNGMSAFAIWDEPRQQLFLARDRMGQKPLYVAFISTGGPSPSIPHALGAPLEGTPAAIAFASELGALKPVSWVDRGLDEVALNAYLQYGYVPHPLSIYIGVKQLSPGTAHFIGRKTSFGAISYFQPTPMFEIGEGPRQYSCSEAITRTRELVTTAVQRQLVADVPLGCFLSGGTDSSVIACAMRLARGSEQRVLTFSIRFDDSRYDESGYAAAVAAHLGTEHRAFKVKPDAAADLPLLAEVFGEPFGDSSALPTHYLARETRQHVKVALSGDGGDELFGGYDRYRAMLWGKRLRTVLTPLPWLAAGPLVRSGHGAHPKSRRARAARFIESLKLSSARRYASYTRLFDDRLIQALGIRRTSDKVEDAGELDFYELHFEGTRGHCGVVRAAMCLDRSTYLPDDLLTKVDRASMLHALEVRSPFMDHELIRFAVNLRTDQLLKGGPKRMLREAFARDLPEWVFRRKKMGFAVPIGDWFRSELRPMLRDHLFAANSFASTHFNRPVVERLVDEHERQRVDHSQRLYALLMLELWWRLQG